MAATTEEVRHLSRTQSASAVVGPDLNINATANVNVNEQSHFSRSVVDVAGSAGSASVGNVGLTRVAMEAAHRRLGQSVNVTVERFVTVGETIAESSPDSRLQMYAACEEARGAGSMMERLLRDVRMDDINLGDTSDNNSAWKSMSGRASMVRAARSLLAAITKVLLLADSVVVKELLLATNQTLHYTTQLESVTNFIEFTRAFSQFGLEMVELTYVISDRDRQTNGANVKEVKDERRRAQLFVAQGVLERSGLMLLTASKVCTRHLDSASARENRDTVFCQMRRAMDLIHYVVKDGILDAAASLVTVPSSLQKLIRKDNLEGNSLASHLQRFLDQVELTKMTRVGPQARQELPVSLEFLLERIQDFTDSAYTSHEDRENILLLCDRVRLQLNQLLRVGISHSHQPVPVVVAVGPDQKEGVTPDEFGPAIEGALRSIVELRTQLQETAILQATEMLKLSQDANELVEGLRNSALTTDRNRLEDVEESFIEHLEHSQEVCKLLRHICPSDGLHIQASYTEINLRIYGPQIPIAAKTLCSNPTSEIAKENLNLFIGMWKKLINDMCSLVIKITEVCRNQKPEIQFYTSLPRPGKHGTTQKQVQIKEPPVTATVKSAQLDSEPNLQEQAKIAKTGEEMKTVASDLEAETDKWGEEGGAPEEDNEIVRKAKVMSNMAYSMYQFTKGDGTLRTTQDLFTQAEYFAEEANRLYKCIRQFSYMVPTSTDKKDLLEKVDEVPTRVQQLQFKVKTPTVGKAATFTKVDSVIQDTKDLMRIISDVISTCFHCARVYSVRMDVFDRGKGSLYRSESDDVGGVGGIGGDSKGGSSSEGGGGRSYGMSRRRGRGGEDGRDGRRTRVSFLLF